MTAPRVLTSAFCVLLGLLALLPSPAPAAGEPNTLTPEEVADGWLLLFDGQTLFGWSAASKANWSVRDGAIQVSEGEKGLLHTNSQFADYELLVDFQAQADTNSGVFLRTSPVVPEGRQGVLTKCYELNIAPPANAFPTGSFVQRKKAEAVAESADWRTFRVLAQGGKFEVQLDGQSVLRYDDPAPLGRGYIGLQFNSGPVSFRNIKLRPLGYRPIFNGKDLSGWKTYPDMASVFSVTPEGWLNVKNGRGQLESAASYEDFTLRLDVYVNGKGLNSGVFFRCIPGETMNGYECQIQNAFVDNDRTKPKDCGTGGFFRRQDARRVVADDFEWFAMTLHVVDNRMAAWVNGYPVSDWSDQRQPDPNPRKGQRLEAGTLQIQGHDPTTDLSFRDIEIVEVPAR